MAVGTGFNQLMQVLNAAAGTDAGVRQPTTPVASTDGRDLGNELSILAGQLAGAFDPGGIGAATGALAAQKGQSKIAEQSGKSSQQAFLDALQGLTGDGVNTTGVTLGDDGTLKITGTQAPDENIASQETIQTGQNLAAIPNQPTNQGGLAAPSNPFLDSLKR